MTTDDIYRAQAGAQYVPANSEEHAAFLESRCDRCLRAERDWQTVLKPTCSIMPRAVFGEPNNPRYPAEWIYAADGSGPCCTAFVARGTPYRQRKHPDQMSLLEELAA